MICTKFSKQDKSWLLNIIAILFKVVLDLGYVFALNKVNAEDFPLEFNYVKFIMSFLMIVFLCMFLPHQQDLSTVYLSIILVYIIEPISTIYCMQNQQGIYFFIIALLFFFVEILLPKINISTKNVISGESISLEWIIEVAAWCIVLLTVILLFLQFGVPGIGAFKLYNIYDIRSSYTISGFVGALFEVTTKALIPFLTALSLLRKKTGTIFLLLFFQVLLFLWLANKATLFSIGVCVVAIIFARKSKNISKIVIVLFALVLALTIVEIFFIDYGQLSNRNSISYILNMGYSLFIRRTMYLPSYLKYCYFDFFVEQGNLLVGLFGTLLGPVLTKTGLPIPYENTTFTKLIGENYYHGSNANTGIYGGELAHFGIAGIFIATVLLCVILLSVKASEHRNGTCFTCILSLNLIIGLADASTLEIVDYSPTLLLVLIMLIFDVKKCKGIKSHNYGKRFSIPQNHLYKGLDL